LAASALDAFDCKFQGRFLFKTEKDKFRAKKMGIQDLKKKYDLKEIVKGDSIFCATGITGNDFLSGITFDKDNFISALSILCGSTFYVIGGLLTLKISNKKNEKTIIL